MRFALLGDGPAATSVAHAVALHSEQQLVCLASRFADGPDKLSRLRGVRCIRNWEELLTDSEVDAVIVAESGEEFQPVVRQLIQAGKAVLVSPELVQSTSFFYELALFDAESPGKLFPLLVLRGHPLVAKLHGLTTSSRLGPIRHVQFERAILPPHASGSERISRLVSHSALASALLVDVDLLRFLFGAYDQVTASRSGDTGAGYSLATVTLAGNGCPQAVWTAVGATSQSIWKLTFLGDSGTAVLEGNPVNGQFRLTLSVSGEAPEVTEITADSGDWLLEQFVASANRQAPPAISPAMARQPVQAFLWDELACAIELVDAVERSVRRRRTIDVHFETPSERGLFKTQMTAVGCSLLMLTLVAVVLYLVLEASIDIPQILRQILVVTIFAPLGIFLVLQLLLFVARPASRE